MNNDQRLKQEKENEIAMQSWLKGQPQDAWLIFATCSNYQWSTKIYEWMLDQDECDRSVAARILWYSCPEYYSSTRDYDDNGYNIIKKIINNFNSGFYSTNQLFLSPYEIMGPVQAYASVKAKSDDSTLIFNIPNALIGPFNGRLAKIDESSDVENDPKLKALFYKFDTTMYQNSERVTSAIFQFEERIKQFHKIPVEGDVKNLSHIEIQYGKLSDYQEALQLLNEADNIGEPHRRKGPETSKAIQQESILWSRIFAEAAKYVPHTPNEEDATKALHRAIRRIHPQGSFRNRLLGRFKRLFYN